MGSGILFKRYRPLESPKRKRRRRPSSLSRRVTNSNIRNTVRLFRVSPWMMMGTSLSERGRNLRNREVLCSMFSTIKAGRSADSRLTSSHLFGRNAKCTPSKTPRPVPKWSGAMLSNGKTAREKFPNVDSGPRLGLPQSEGDPLFRELQ